MCMLKCENFQVETLVNRGYYKNCSQADAVGVYIHTRNVEDYINYTEALNLATTEIKISKRTLE